MTDHKEIPDLTLVFAEIDQQGADSIPDLAVAIDEVLSAQPSQQPAISAAVEAAEVPDLTVVFDEVKAVGSPSQPRAPRRKRTSFDITFKGLKDTEQALETDLKTLDPRSQEYFDARDRLEKLRLARELREVQIVTHGKFERDKSTNESKLVPVSDTDGRTAVWLLRTFAGNKSNWSEYSKDEKYNSRVGRRLPASAVIDKDGIAYVAPGNEVIGAQNVDTSGAGAPDYEWRTKYRDHHGRYASDNSSATKKVFELLLEAGLVKESDREALRKMVDFVTVIDTVDSENREYVKYLEDYEKNGHKKLYSLYRMIFDTRQLWRFFKDGHAADEDLSKIDRKALQSYGIVYKDNKSGDFVNKMNAQKEFIEELLQKLEELEQKGLVMESEEFGKVVVCPSLVDKIPSGSDAVYARYDRKAVYVSCVEEDQASSKKKFTAYSALKFPDEVNEIGVLASKKILVFDDQNFEKLNQFLRILGVDEQQIPETLKVAVVASADEAAVSTKVAEDMTHSSQQDGGNIDAGQPIRAVENASVAQALEVDTPVDFSTLSEEAKIQHVKDEIAIILARGKTPWQKIVDLEHLAYDFQSEGDEIKKLFSEEIKKLDKTYQRVDDSLSSSVVATDEKAEEAEEEIGRGELEADLFIFDDITLEDTDDKTKEEFIGEVEEIGAKEKVGLSEGAANLGYWVAQRKSEMFSRVFKKGAKVFAGGTTGTFLDKYADIYSREAAQSQKMREIKDKGVMSKAVGLGRGLGIVFRYGRILYDFNVANPFRHATAAAMTIGRLSEAGKETRFANVSKKDSDKLRTRVQDIERAEAEAYSIVEKLKSEGINRPTDNDISRILKDNLSADILARIERGDNVSMSMIQRFMRRDISFGIKQVEKKINKIEKNKKYTLEQKAQKKKEILTRYELLLSDLDRMTDDAGIVDGVAHFMRSAEKAGKITASIFVLDSVSRLASTIGDVISFSEKYDDILRLTKGRFNSKLTITEKSSSVTSTSQVVDSSDIPANINKQDFIYESEVSKSDVVKANSEHSDAAPTPVAESAVNAQVAEQQQSAYKQLVESITSNKAIDEETKQQLLSNNDLQRLLGDGAINEDDAPEIVKMIIEAQGEKLKAMGLTAALTNTINSEQFIYLQTLIDGNKKDIAEALVKNTGEFTVDEMNLTKTILDQNASFTHSRNFSSQIIENLRKSGDPRAALATVYKGEGIIHSFTRQLETDPELARAHEFTGQPNELHEWAQTKASQLAVKAGYVEPGSMREVWVARPNEAAYVLKTDGSMVEEFVKDESGLYIDSLKDKTFDKITINNGNTKFEDENIDKHEMLHGEVRHKDVVSSNTIIEGSMPSAPVALNPLAEEAIQPSATVDINSLDIMTVAGMGWHDTQPPVEEIIAFNNKIYSGNDFRANMEFNNFNLEKQKFFVEFYDNIATRNVGMDATQLKDVDVTAAKKIAGDLRMAFHDNFVKHYTLSEKGLGTKQADFFHDYVASFDSYHDLRRFESMVKKLSDSQMKEVLKNIGEFAVSPRGCNKFLDISDMIRSLDGVSVDQRESLMKLFYQNGFDKSELRDKVLRQLFGEESYYGVEKFFAFNRMIDRSDQGGEVRIVLDQLKWFENIDKLEIVISPKGTIAVSGPLGWSVDQKPLSQASIDEVVKKIVRFSTPQPKTEPN